MKNILMITTGFAPQNRIGAIRTTKIAKYLVRSGYSVTVITTDIQKNEKIDITLSSEEIQNTKIYRIPRGRLFTKTLFTIRNKMLKDKSTSTYLESKNNFYLSSIKQKLIKFALFVYTFLESNSWQREVMKVTNREFRDKDFDVIISSFPKLSSHQIALRLVKKKKSSIWIADFRDPIAYENLHSPLIYKVYSKIQRNICNHATQITYVSRNMYTTLATGVSNKKKFHYLSNGFDEDDLQYIKNAKLKIEEEYKGIFKMCYVGSLYGGKRNLSIIFKLLRELIDESEIDICKIKFLYAGQEFETLKQQAADFNLEEILVNYGYVSREESISIQTLSNLIVVNTWNTEKDQGVIPGKVYECFLLKKPTLAITNGTLPKSELGTMITKSGLGIAYDTMVEDKGADIKLKKFIFNFYLSTINCLESPIELNNEYINEFNYKQIINKLKKIIKN